MSRECTVAAQRWLPGWLFRAVVLLCCTGLLALLVQQSVPIGLVAVLGAFASVAVLAPATLSATLVIGGAALLATVAGGAELRWQVLAMIPLAHLLHVAAAHAALIPAASRVHPATLRPPLIRFAVVELVTFAMVGLAAVLPSGQRCGCSTRRA
jgi:hypothetical protein